MAKKKHSSGSNKSSSQKPLEQKTTSTRTTPPFKALTPPSPKSSSSSESHPKIIEPSNSMKQKLSNRPRKRLFTKKDDILILKGLLDFKSKTCNDTMTHFCLFYNSFNDWLSVKPIRRQLRKRIFVKGECSDNMGYLSMDVNVLKRGMELIEESEREELERRWKRLKLQEMKLFVQRFELVDLIFEALQPSS